MEAASGPVDTRYSNDIGFLLDFHCDVYRLHIDTELTSKALVLESLFKKLAG